MSWFNGVASAGFYGATALGQCARWVAPQDLQRGQRSHSGAGALLTVRTGNKRAGAVAELSWQGASTCRHCAPWLSSVLMRRVLLLLCLW